MPFDPCTRVALLATLLLASCASVTPGRMPPYELLQPCSVLLDTPATNGELARQRASLASALKRCDKDKSDLREWFGIKE